MMNVFSAPLLRQAMLTETSGLLKAVADIKYKIGSLWLNMSKSNGRFGQDTLTFVSNTVLFTKC